MGTVIPFQPRPKPPPLVAEMFAVGGTVTSECTDVMHIFLNGRSEPCQCGEHAWPKEAS